MRKYLLLLLTLFALNSCEEEPEIISVEADKKLPKVNVCHYDADTDTWKTLSINGNALKAHLKHGDYLGVCANDLDEDGFTIEQGDCNDEDATIYPGAPELCDGIDNDCDDDIDEDNGTDPVADAGGPYVIELHTNPSSIVYAEDLSLSGSLSAATSCEDAIMSWEWDLNNDGIKDFTGISPQLTWEIFSYYLEPDYYNTSHNISLKVTDTKGRTSQNQAIIFIMYDADQDSFYPWIPLEHPYYDESLLDCDDNDKTVYPEAPEICDSLDNDCNGEVDDNCIPEIGKFYQGGILFHIFSEDEAGYVEGEIHGLVAAEEALEPLSWGDAKVLVEYNIINGFDDWYLPSTEEISLLYYNFCEETDCEALFYPTGYTGGWWTSTEHHTTTFESYFIAIFDPFGIRFRPINNNQLETFCAIPIRMF